MGFVTLLIAGVNLAAIVAAFLVAFGFWVPSLTTVALISLAALVWASSARYSLRKRGLEG
jgi:hypothetical protein